MLVKEYKTVKCKPNYREGTALGISKATCLVIEKIKKVAYSDFSVLLEGETGVGKALVAQMIHRCSQRAQGPFIKIDIAAIPETLLESELFGYKKGAFTGANTNKKGFFEAANGGTLFLDELENLTLYAQSKLLGVLEDRIVVPIGSTTPINIDVRIISATNNNLKQAVIDKSFREDLYFRLCEFDILIPPLRERPDDIQKLAHDFLRQATVELGKKITEINDEAMSLLLGYPWPGNVRELKNVIRRAALLCEDNCLSSLDIALLTREQAQYKTQGNLEIKNFPKSLHLDELEQWAIRQALTVTDGRAMKAAVLVGMAYQKFKRKLKKYCIAKTKTPPKDFHVTGNKQYIMARVKNPG
ncbi:MAG: sigma-54 dependent transcriptional regulator [Acidobacteria bacterium]|jgi:transcriptional regulator with PAS, ATPase and Fis domain|nr:sigma-54 dependent transcriptional regulator [Acidobacteriota bacterium]